MSLSKYKITSKIKFCASKATSTERLKHYWALYRKTKNNDLHFGLKGLPVIRMDSNFEINKLILEKRLNEADAFDLPIVFKHEDQLDIIINNQDDELRVVYGFKYVRGKWKIAQKGDSDLLWWCEEVAFGKIKTGGRAYRLFEVV